jgi:hypothetical protein
MAEGGWEAVIARIDARCHHAPMRDDEGTGHWRRRAKGCGGVLAVVVLLPFLLLKACQWSDAHPTDKALIEEFQRNRAAFIDLRDMIAQEPRVTRVAEDFIWIDGMHNVSEADRPTYLPDERLARYKSLFEELTLESGVIRYEDGSIGFLRSSSGMVTGGSSKEFIWSQRLSGPGRAPSDSRRLKDACVPRSGCSSVQQIAPEWFISFERN